MEINIESSLAAMAFVVADQQDELRQYRELCKQLEEEKDKSDAALADKIEELGRCEYEIHLLHDDIDKLKSSLKERSMEVESFKRDVDYLSVELDKCRINWQAVDPENTGKNVAIIAPPEVLDRNGVILVKHKVISDGIVTVDCRPIAVGSYFLTVEYAQMNDDGGFYILLEPNTLSKPVQYAVVPRLAEKEVFDV